MTLVTKLKEMMPWKREPMETHEVLSLRDDINRLFDRFFMPSFDSDWGTVRGWDGGVEMGETDDEVVVRIEVAGLDPRYLDVTVRDGVLDVRYERQEEYRARNGHGAAQHYARFHRTIMLPDGVDTSGAEASCKHGLLTVRVPWSKEAKDRQPTHHSIGGMTRRPAVWEAAPGVLSCLGDLHRSDAGLEE